MSTEEASLISHIVITLALIFVIYRQGARITNGRRARDRDRDNSDFNF